MLIKAHGGQICIRITDSLKIDGYTGNLERFEGIVRQLVVEKPGKKGSAKK